MGRRSSAALQFISSISQEVKGKEIHTLGVVRHLVLVLVLLILLVLVLVLVLLILLIVCSFYLLGFRGAELRVSNWL